MADDNWHMACMLCSQMNKNKLCMLLIFMVHADYLQYIKLFTTYFDVLHFLRLLRICTMTVLSISLMHVII